MGDLTVLVGNTAVLTTVASNFAGLPVCLDMVNRKSTTGVSFLPFLSAAICTSLWFQYGLLIGDSVVSAVNLVAVFMQCCYLGCFYYVTANKKRVLRTQSTESLPFLIIFSTFIATMLWYTYGVLISDSFVKVPNLIGALLSGFQLSLFAIFDSKTGRPGSD